MDLHAQFIYGTPAEAARALPDKQIEVLKQIRMANEGDTLSVYSINSVSYSTLRKMRDRGLITMHTGGVHGGSHKGYVALTSYSKGVLNFIAI